MTTASGCWKGLMIDSHNRPLRRLQLARLSGAERVENSTGTKSVGWQTKMADS